MALIVKVPEKIKFTDAESKDGVYVVQKTISLGETIDPKKTQVFPQGFSVQFSNREKVAQVLAGAYALSYDEKAVTVEVQLVLDDDDDHHLDKDKSWVKPIVVAEV